MKENASEWKSRASVLEGQWKSRASILNENGNQELEMQDKNIVSKGRGNFRIENENFYEERNSGK